MKRREMKSRVLLVVCAGAAIGLLTGAATAGEITGNGKWIAGDADAPLHGKSICAYSGRQDNYEEDAGFFRGMIVQNWGQIPKFMRDMLTMAGMNPGNSCNPSRGGGEP